MKLKIIVASLIGFCIFAEQEKQIVAHAVTEKERKEIIINDLFGDIFRFSMNDSSLNQKEFALYLLNTYGQETEFKFVCTLFDVMHKECEGKVSITENTMLGRGWREIKALVEKNMSKEITFISLYKSACDFYSRFIKCPEFIKIYNVFLLINAHEELKADQQQADARIKKFKRMALGAFVAGLVEGGLNAFHAEQ